MDEFLRNLLIDFESYFGWKRITSLYIDIKFDYVTINNTLKGINDLINSILNLFSDGKIFCEMNYIDLKGKYIIPLVNMTKRKF
jgi:hypothetical protein